MTLTVNGQPADPGCYVEGHWGQYGPDHLADQLEGFGVSIGRQADPRFARRVADRCFNDFPDLEADAWERYHYASDSLETVAAGATEGGYWEWHEGECFLRSYVCPECGNDARVRLYDQGHGDDIPEIDRWMPAPCDFCCDADDPGCFA